MSRRILIIPDKFKGSLAATEAAEAIASGWAAAWPEDSIDRIPMSDGGDGFGEVMAGSLGFAKRLFRGTDAAGRVREIPCWLDSNSSQAVVEAAQSNGLALLPPGRFHPFELDTFGVGDLLMKLGQAGAEHCLVGVGGSATNDAGFGMARALGWRFLDGAGDEIGSWTGLDELDAITRPEPSAWPSVTVAMDVTNPLLGVDGATRVYGPQKGMREEDFAKADACFNRLAMITAETIGTDFAITPGAGAAGGLGFGLMAFAGATFRSGFEVFAESTRLESRIVGAELVITAEGSIDAQTLMGKGTGQVAQLCQQLAKPCVGLAGLIELGQAEGGNAVSPFYRLASVVPDLATEQESMADAAGCLERLSKRLAIDLPPS